VENTLSQIVKDAFETQCEEYAKIAEETARLLRSETGRVGNFDILGRLIRLKPSGEALIVGDLHGDLESLVDILKKSRFLQRMNQTSSAVLIFLGDYGDRGEFSAEVYYTVLKLKFLFPSQVILMRGNHESPVNLLASPHDLPEQFQRRFGANWEALYSKILKLFDVLYVAVLVKGRYIIVHGGLSQDASMRDLAYAHVTHPKNNLLEDMLWSDPEEIKDVYPSPRGAGRLFGESTTTRALRRLGVKILIRGHEPCEEGFKINHSGKVLTLFSRKGPPYFNTSAAYLDLDLSKEIENANQLVPYIHRF
jgi:diadenosine tetraphosphatase ApaH/serine/threonine PP2A family protein phosphatase